MLLTSVNPAFAAPVFDEQEEISEDVLLTTDTETGEEFQNDDAEDVSLSSVSTVSDNVVSSNRPNIHAAQFSGAEPKVQMLNDGRYVAVKGQKIYMGIGGTSSDSKVIGVNRKGIAKAKKTGKATLTYPDGTVLDVEVVDVKTAVKSVKMSVGESTNVSLNAGGLEEKGLKIAYQASKPNVVQVDGGHIVAVAKGSVKVTATVGGKSYTTNVKVADKPGSSLVLDAYIGTKGTKVPVKGMTEFNISTADSDSAEEDASKKISSKQGIQVIKNRLAGYQKGKYSISSNGRTLSLM